MNNWCFTVWETLMGFSVSMGVSSSFGKGPCRHRSAVNHLSIFSRLLTSCPSGAQRRRLCWTDWATVSGGTFLTLTVFCLSRSGHPGSGFLGAAGERRRTEPTVEPGGQWGFQRATQHQCVERNFLTDHFGAQRRKVMLFLN